MVGGRLQKTREQRCAAPQRRLGCSLRHPACAPRAPLPASRPACYPTVYFTPHCSHSQQDEIGRFQGQRTQDLEAIKVRAGAASLLRALPSWQGLVSRASCSWKSKHARGLVARGSWRGVCLALACRLKLHASCLQLIQVNCLPWPHQRLGTA